MEKILVAGEDLNPRHADYDGSNASTISMIYYGRFTKNLSTLSLDPKLLQKTALIIRRDPRLRVTFNPDIQGKTI